MAKEPSRLEWQFFDAQGLDDHAWTQLQDAGRASHAAQAAGTRYTALGRRRVIITIALLLVLLGVTPPPPGSEEPSVVPPVAGSALPTQCNNAPHTRHTAAQACTGAIDPIEQHRYQQLPRCRGEMDPIEQRQSQRPPPYLVPLCTNP